MNRYSVVATLSDPREGEPCDTSTCLGQPLDRETAVFIANHAADRATEPTWVSVYAPDGECIYERKPDEEG